MSGVTSFRCSVCVAVWESRASPVFDRPLHHRQRGSRLLALRVDRVVNLQRASFKGLSIRAAMRREAKSSLASPRFRMEWF